MNPFNRHVHRVLCCLLMGLGVSAQSVQAAFTCEFDNPRTFTWYQKVAQIDKSLPLGTVIFERTVLTKIYLKKTTNGNESIRLYGHLMHPDNLLPTPLFAFPVSGTATGGGALKGFGLRQATLTGDVFKRGKLLMMDTTFDSLAWSFDVFHQQQIVLIDNSALEGGVLNSANNSSVVIYPLGAQCNTVMLNNNLNVTIPAPNHSTCTLDTTLKNIGWPALSSSEMPLNGTSHKRSMDIVLSKCGKGVKPYIHFASYRDLARNQLNNPVVSVKDKAIIKGLTIRAKNASNGADIRFGDPNATTGDLANRFTIGTAANENATLTQKVDFYLERTADKLIEGEWMSNMSFIISYP